MLRDDYRINGHCSLKRAENSLTYLLATFVSDARQGFFESGDSAALLAKLPDYARPLVEFASYTAGGFRAKYCASPGRKWISLAMQLPGHKTRSVFDLACTLDGEMRDRDNLARGVLHTEALQTRSVRIRGRIGTRTPLRYCGAVTSFRSPPIGFLRHPRCQRMDDFLIRFAENSSGIRATSFDLFQVR
jgi:hypothetical protein